MQMKMKEELAESESVCVRIYSYTYTNSISKSSSFLSHPEIPYGSRRYDVCKCFRGVSVAQRYETLVHDSKVQKTRLSTA